MLNVNHSKKETKVLVSNLWTEIYDDFLNAKCAATLMSIISSYLGDQEDLVLQGTQTLGSPLPHFVLVGLQSVREGSKLTFPIKSLPPRLFLSKLLIHTLKEK